MNFSHGKYYYFYAEDAVLVISHEGLSMACIILLHIVFVMLQMWSHDVCVLIIIAKKPSL